jgi:hypothetical protein
MSLSHGGFALTQIGCDVSRIDAAFTNGGTAALARVAMRKFRVVAFPFGLIAIFIPHSES